MQSALHAGLVPTAGPVGVVGSGGLDESELDARRAVVLVHGVDLSLKLGVLWMLLAIIVPITSYSG